MNYDVRVHSSVALAEQVDAIQLVNPEARIVGSLGRSVLLKRYCGNSQTEYDARNENPLYDNHGRARDIDVIHYMQSAKTAPFAIDSKSFRNSDVRITKSGPEWWLQSDIRNFAEEIDPAVMQPVTGPGVHGIHIRTLLMQTHLALTASRGQLRRKDEIGYNMLSSILRHERPQLPNELYDPFRRLASLPLPPGVRLRQYTYRRLIPEKLETALTPLLEKARVLPSEEIN